MEELFYNLLMQKKDKVVGLSFVSGNNNVNFKSSDINLGLGDFTVEIYARSEGSKGVYSSMFGFDKSPYMPNSFFVYGSSSTSTNSLSWCPLVERPLEGGDTTNSISMRIEDSTKNPYHIVITRQGTTMKTYINGVLKATKVQDRVLDFSNFVYSVANTSLFTLGRVFNFCATQSFVTELWNGGNVINYKLSETYKGNEPIIVDSYTLDGVTIADDGSYYFNNPNGEYVFISPSNGSSLVYSKGFKVTFKAKGTGNINIVDSTTGIINGNTIISINSEDYTQYSAYGCFTSSVRIFIKRTSICNCYIKDIVIEPINNLLEYLPISIRTDKILDTSGQDNHGVFTGNPQKVTQSQINQGA